MKFTPEHDALRRTTKQFVDSQINPFVDEWKKRVFSSLMNYSEKW